MIATVKFYFSGCLIDESGKTQSFFLHYTRKRFMQLIVRELRCRWFVATTGPNCLKEPAAANRTAKASALLCLESGRGGFSRARPFYYS